MGRNLPDHLQGQRAEETQGPDSGTCQPRGPVSPHSRTVPAVPCCWAPARLGSQVPSGTEDGWPAEYAPAFTPGRVLSHSPGNTGLHNRFLAPRPGLGSLSSKVTSLEWGRPRLPLSRWVGRELCPRALRLEVMAPLCSAPGGSPPAPGSGPLGTGGGPWAGSGLGPRG